MGDYQRMQRVTRTTALSQLGNLRWMWGRSFHSSSYSWKSPEPFSVLGIETSCDDTCAAVVGCDGRVWAHALSSQFQVHAPYHGIVPSLAARAHEAHIDTIVDQVLQEASQQHGTLLPPVHCVAVTAGPGLKPCLGVGLKKAQQIAEDWNVPLLPIHHLEAHALVPRLPSLSSSVEFPFLLLLVSGGHTQLIECQGVGHYRILGTTLDDAVGEAFDKTARLLGLQPSPDCHPGEQLERLAQEGDPSAIQFTLPLSKRKKSCDFSYSGLKNPSPKENGATGVAYPFSHSQCGRRFPTNSHSPSCGSSALCFAYASFPLYSCRRRRCRAQPIHSFAAGYTAR